MVVKKGWHTNVDGITRRARGLKQRDGEWREWRERVMGALERELAAVCAKYGAEILPYNEENFMLKIEDGERMSGGLVKGLRGGGVFDSLEVFESDREVVEAMWQRHVRVRAAATEVKRRGRPPKGGK